MPARISGEERREGLKWGNRDKLLERGGNQKQYQVLLRRQTKRGEGWSTQSNRCNEKVTQDLHHKYRHIVHKNSCTKHTRSGSKLKMERTLQCMWDCACKHAWAYVSCVFAHSQWRKSVFSVCSTLRRKFNWILWKWCRLIGVMACSWCGWSESP